MSNVHEGSAQARGYRIGPLANLPVFFKLEGKRVVLAGGEEPTLWKAELLAAAGALVEVFAESFANGFKDLSASPPRGRILLVNRVWTANDLTGASLAVGSFADEAEAAAFASAARASGVPVNVVDRPAFCDFQFGAIVNRSPLVVGISTDGAAPVFGQAIRSLVEALLPESFRHWAVAARDLRRGGDHVGDTPEDKRRFWRRFTDFAMRNSRRGPTEEDVKQLIASASVPDVQAEPVTLIGIGEDPDALTLGAIRALRTADDIFFDEGVPVSVMDFARREARRHPVPASAANSSISPSLLKALAETASKGGRVVRLKLCLSPDRSGTSEEVDALRAVGISVVVVPSPLTS